VSKEYYTVVYCVDGDKALHDKWWQDIYPIFLATDLPISVVGLALGDKLDTVTPYDVLDA
jgi:hypothetical protein